MFAFFLGIVGGLAFLYLKKENNILRAEIEQLREHYEEHILDIMAHSQGAIIERMREMKK